MGDEKILISENSEFGFRFLGFDLHG